MHGQRAHPHGLERHRQGVRIDAGRDQDGSGSLDHDPLGGREAVELRHLHVHGHDVGVEALHHLHRLQPIRGLAHHLDLGIGTQDGDEHLAGGGGVVDDQDADPLHRSWPTASSRRRLSKPPFTM